MLSPVSSLSCVCFGATSLKLSLSKLHRLSSTTDPIKASSNLPASAGIQQNHPVLPPAREVSKTLGQTASVKGQGLEKKALSPDPFTQKDITMPQSPYLLVGMEFTIHVWGVAKVSALLDYMADTPTHEVMSYLQSWVHVVVDMKPQYVFIYIYALRSSFPYIQHTKTALVRQSAHHLLTWLQGHQKHQGHPGLCAEICRRLSINWNSSSKPEAG